MAIPSGEIYLLKNAPLTATYEHTIDFKDKSEQFSYFLSFKKYTLENYTYIRKEREYISINMTMTEVDDVNYLLFRSADGERLYYAFVTDKSYVAPHTTNIYFSIDVMQTYMFDYEFKESYIAQAHVDRWTAEHKPIYSKTDEGLDYGSEYSVESAFKLEQSSVIKWLLVSMTDYSEILKEGMDSSGGTLNPAGSPFACFVVPLLLTKDGATSERIDGRSIFVKWFNSNGVEETKEIASYQDFIWTMYSSALGNYVRSISLLTYAPFVESEIIEETKITVNFKSSVVCSTSKFDAVRLPLLLLYTMPESMLKGAQMLARADWNVGLEDSLPTSAQWDEVKKNPYTTKRDKRFESKLLCSPYRYNIMTDWRNDSVTLKNEYMTTDKIEVLFSYALSFNAPFRFWIKNYKKDPLGRNNSLLQAIAPDFPVLSDAYYTYMLENKNTIEANLTNAKISAATSTLMSAGNGAIAGAQSGGGWGALAGAGAGLLNGTIQGATNINALVRSENAKQKDLKAKPDTVINSNDSSFNILDDNADVNFYRMRICCENEAILAEIFNMSGYKVNRVEKPNLRSRTRFNYIQTVGANIVGSFSQADLLKIKEIYDKGVTIWHYNKDNFNYLDYSFENMEVNLI